MKNLIWVWIFFVVACSSDAPESKTMAYKEKAEKMKEKKNKPTPRGNKLFPKISGRTAMNFPSKDGLQIAANLFHIGPEFPVIILCHQAKSSKEEYDEAALKLNDLGYNCLALDQRSGGTALGGRNISAEHAQEAQKPTEFLDAEQDILSAIDFMYKMYEKEVTLVGSSYSASLALKIGATNDKVKAIAAFSPGEYFDDQTLVERAVQKLKKPVFVTSSLKESAALSTLTAKIASKKKVHYIPEEEGIHGARALWSKTEGSAGYWKSFTKFLQSIE